jgi:hypothetical protein
MWPFYFNLCSRFRFLVATRGDLGVGLPGKNFFSWEIFMDRMKATELQRLTVNVSGVPDAAGKPGIKFAYLKSWMDLFNRISGRMSERA